MSIKDKIIALIEKMEDEKKLQLIYELIIRL